MRVIVASMALVAITAVVCVSGVPVAHDRLAAHGRLLSGTLAGVLQESGAVTDAVATPDAPVLSSDFHTAYSLYLLNMGKSLLPDLSNMIDRASRLLDGEAWQNVSPATTPGGAPQITIKTVTTPSLIGRAVTAPMTQTWVQDHGWTESKGKCTRDAVNTQLVISGSILRDAGTFKGTKNIKPINAKLTPSPKPQPDGTYKVDEWDAVLPNGEGRVTYFLLHGVQPPTPIMSHYALKGKPAVWAQYHFFKPVHNADAVYAPTPACRAVATAAKAAPATFSNASLKHL